MCAVTKQEITKQIEQAIADYETKKSDYAVGYASGILSAHFLTFSLSIQEFCAYNEQLRALITSGKPIKLI